MTALQEKQIYVHYELMADLSHLAIYRMRLRIILIQNSIFPKFSYNTCDKVLRRRNIYWYHEKCTQSTFTMPKAIYNANIYNLKLEHMTERKTRERQ